MIDHLSLGTTDLARASSFYDALLQPLGVVRVWSVSDGVGYGLPGGGDKLAIKLRPGARPPGAGAHVAFTSRSRAGVDEAYRAGLAAGGEADGGPGPRPHYGPGYYAACLIDPDGHRIEIVFHEPPAS